MTFNLLSLCMFVPKKHADKEAVIRINLWVTYVVFYDVYMNDADTCVCQQDSLASCNC